MEGSTGPTPEPIVRVAQGFMAAKHLFTAEAVGLFPALADGPLTLEELAGRTGSGTHGARIVADAMVALGFCERDGDTYRNAPVADTFLAGRRGPDLRPFLRFWDQISYPAWMGLADAVRTGEPAIHDLSEELSTVFSEGVEALTFPTAAALAASDLLDNTRRLLDVGGGTGSFLAAALAGRPEVEGTLAERAPTTVLARKHLDDTPVGNRVEVVEVDALAGPLPGGHDTVLVANLVHLFTPGNVVTLFRRCREAVEPGARLLAVDFWTDPTHTDPLPAALIAGEFLVVAGGSVYSFEEIEAWMTETGWAPKHRGPLAYPASVIVAEAV
jgi:SAM-dependent methyltransferase